MIPGEFSGYRVGFFVPWQGQGAVGKLRLGRQIQKRGEKRALFQSARSAKLRNRQDALLPWPGYLSSQVIEGHSTVCSSEINSDRKVCHTERLVQVSSTSAGVMIRASKDSE